VKHISKTEFQMWMDCAPAYFEYMAKVLFHGRASILVKILGVHEIETFKRRTGKRKVVQVVVMENLFIGKGHMTKTFDLKGAHRQIDLRKLLQQDQQQQQQAALFEQSLGGTGFGAGSDLQSTVGSGGTVGANTPQSTAGSGGLLSPVGTQVPKTEFQHITGSVEDKGAIL
jgi:hypothetical protein